MKKRMTRTVALLLAMLMVFANATTASAQGAEYAQSLELSYIANDAALPASALEQEDVDFLLSTLTQEPVRMFGFEGNYALPNNPNEMVDIVVQFRTPPAVAQRLIHDAENPLARTSGRMMDAAFAPSALEAHASFTSELTTVPMPRSAMGGVEIVSEHHMLFNGMYMRVPVSMVESISMLPEVFAVTPAMTPHTLQDLEAMANGTFGEEPALSGDWYTSESLNNIIDNGVLVVPENFMDYEYTWHPEFNQGAREMFELDYINYEMGITGAGIRVGIVDTGIDYRHPAYWHMLIPVDDGMGFVRDETGQYWSLPGGNFMTTPLSGRATGRGTSGMEMIHGPGASHSTHGTHVAGIALGMAPGVQLYSFRILAPEPGGGGIPQAPLLAIEYAYYLELDVLNNSWGYTHTPEISTNHPWWAFAYATNVAALTGMVSANGTGNDGVGGATARTGVGGWFSLGGGGSTASLGISVASGQGGNRHLLGLGTATINGAPAPELVISGVPMDFDPWTDLPAGDLQYTWFGRLTVPLRSVIDDAFVQQISDEFLDGGNLEGQIAVFARGGGELLSYHFLGYRLGAVGVIVTNNAAGPITGTTHNSPNPADPPLMVPNFSMGLPEADMHFGEAVPVPNPPLTGTINLGGIVHSPSPDLKTPSSSIGPLGPISGHDSSDALMHIFPNVTAPGANIVSTFTITHPNQINGRPYHAQGGTSMSGPVIAGVAALLIEHLNPPLATRSVEVQARIMQTARPLTAYAGQYCVNQVGAGVIVPLAALTATAFATTVHSIPFAHGVSMDDIDYQLVGNHLRVMANHTMASMSFGRVETAEDEPAATATLPITIHSDDTWTFAGLEWLMPTQELRNPATGNWTGNWGPRLQHTITGVDYNLVSTGRNSYEIYLTHTGALDNRGFAQGHIFFTNNYGEEIFMIFGAYFDVELPPPPPADLSVRANTGIWRPVISGFVSPNYGGFDDPREFPGGWLADQGIYMMTARSNYSPVTFGFNDNTNTPRNVRFYIGPYGTPMGDPAKRFHTQFTSTEPNTNWFAGNLLRPIVGGSVWNIGGQPTWQASDGYALSPGLYTLTMFVANPGGEDLVAPFHFAVTTDRPTITFDQDVFLYAEGDEYVTVTGSVSSLGHDLAIENNLMGMTAWAGIIDLVPGNTGLFDYSQSTLWTADAEFAVNADGTFSLEWPIAAGSPTTINLHVTDGEGLGIVPTTVGGAWSSVIFAAANRSVATPFTYAARPTVGFDIFNNGPGGTQYPQPNHSLQEAGLIRMRPQINGEDALFDYGAASTIVALDQDGNCARSFVHVHRLWSDDDGWLDTFMAIDVNKNGNWEYINFSITVMQQEIEVLLVNSLFERPAENVTVTFVAEAGAVGVYAAATTTVTVPAGEAIPASAIPSTDARTGFYFAGWEPSDPAEFGTVTEDITFTARFNPLFHYVTFEAGNGGELAPTSFGLTVRIRDGFTFWPDRVPTPVANAGYEFVEWTPYNPAGYVVRDNMTFTAVFAESTPVTPQIVSVTPNPATVARGGMVEIVVTTQGMPDGAWIDLNVAWRPGLSVVGGPRFYIVDNQATITVSADAGARLGRDGFAVAARVAGQWGSVVILDSYSLVIEVQ